MNQPLDGFKAKIQPENGKIGIADQGPFDAPGPDQLRWSSRCSPPLTPRAQRMVAAYERTYGASGPGCCPEALAAALEELDISVMAGAARQVAERIDDVINELRGMS